MSRKFDTASAVLALAFLLIAASSSFAQRDPRTVGPVVSVGPVLTGPRAQRVPVLGCCKCLGGTNTLDLSTVGSNAWTVNGTPVVFLTSIHPLWNVNPGPAKWVSTIASGASNVAVGDYEYRLDFVVPECTIGQRVTLSGNVGGDDGFDVYLDSTSSSSLSSCAGWCFNTQKPLHTFTSAVSSGSHTLIVKIHNSGGPSGMFVNATLTGACKGE